LNVSENSLVDKEIEFANKEFRNEMLVFGEKIIETSERLGNIKYFDQEMMKSEAYHNTINYFQHNFCWKVGIYTIKLTFEDSDGKIFDETQQFKLQKSDVDELSENIKIFKNHFKRVMIEGEETKVKFNTIDTFLIPENK